jgi:SAM-dependent methyltransferase
MAAPDAPVPQEVVHYGPDVPTEADLRLLGQVTDRRVLVLGCHSPRSCVALAQQGAKVIVYEPNDERLGRARAACEKAEVKAELRNLDLADLALLQADSIDLTLSVYAIGEVLDLDRVLRQVHRVLGPGAPFVLSLPHPAYAMLDRSGQEPPSLARPYLSTALPSIEPLGEGGPPRGEPTHTPSALFGSLSRAKFRVDTLLEPPALTTHGLKRWAPPALILRARKEGV